MATMSDIPSLSVKGNYGASVPGFHNFCQTGGMTDQIGKTVRRLRKERSLTQMDLAAALDYSRTAISGLETGGDKPGRDLLEALATFFGVTVGELYEPSAGPQPGEFIKDQDELALLRFWRSLDDAGQRLFLLSLSKGRDGAK